MGHSQAVTFREEAREFGETKYSIWKMLNLASNGITSLGVTGEYIGKIYMEMKQRPSYLISKTNTLFPSDYQKEGTYSSCGNCTDYLVGYW